MNNANKIAEALGHVSEGWREVPVIPRPPKIHWGEEFLSWNDQKKLDYLMKFAEAMNHAAATIQDERDALGRLVELKEKQLEQQQAAMEANNMMLQTEIGKMNEYKQETMANIAKLNARIRELEKG